MARGPTCGPISFLMQPFELGERTESPRTAAVHPCFQAFNSQFNKREVKSCLIASRLFWCGSAFWCGSRLGLGQFQMVVGGT